MSLIRTHAPFWSARQRIPSSAYAPERLLQVDRRAMAQAIAAAGPLPSLAGIVLDHAVTHLRLLLRGVSYRRCGQAARDAYRRMSTAQFSAINGRQAWANWRTIPRNLSGRLPVDRPLTVLDLCCGTGQSTRVLAWWLPFGSRIIAYEQDARFAAIAAARTYSNRAGWIVPVAVRCISVLDGFQTVNGARLPSGSVDVVHAIGSLGCHFQPSDSAVIVNECARVLAPGGFALLDAGRSGTSATELRRLAVAAGLVPEGSARSWLGDRLVQLALRQPGAA
jgi:SAM-dependent methyltransferase